MANTHRMILGSAWKALPGVPDKQITALQLQFARQLYDRCLERHGNNHEQTRLVLDYISALENRTADLPLRHDDSSRREISAF